MSLDGKVWTNLGRRFSDVTEGEEEEEEQNEKRRGRKRKRREKKEIPMSSVDADSTVWHIGIYY